MIGIKEDTIEIIMEERVKSILENVRITDQ